MEQVLQREVKPSAWMGLAVCWQPLEVSSMFFLPIEQLLLINNVGFWLLALWPQCRYVACETHLGTPLSIVYSVLPLN